jgi:glycerophosphoryl diester phosphodiesterase
MRTLAVATVSLALVAVVSGGGRPLIAAHRGGALLWPENSLTAFRGALGLGVDLVELDVHLTKDGEVVVIHDPTLERTTTGRGAVRDHAWAELGAVTVKGTTGERPPKLEEVLDLIRPTPVGLLLEIKAAPDRTRYASMEEKVLGLLDARGLAPRTTVMAFDWAVLERLRELSPTLRLTGLLGRRGAEQIGGVRPAVERLARLKVNDLGIERTLLAPEAVAAARAAGLTIGVWTVNEADELRAALAAGVDYVTTDRPDLALRLRGQP